MSEKVLITVFTEPMMGLSYESEPILRKLETHFPDRIRFWYVMSCLVPDVYRLVDPGELPLDREKAIERYNRRLAKIYEDEESISGMPINMEGFCLFDTEHTSSMPLNLAYKAAQLTHPAKAEQFLYNLRFATVVDCRPTTRTEEIMVVARKTGLDEQVFLDHFNSHTTRDELELDLQFGRKLGIYSLPSYLIQWGNRGVLIQSFHYGDFLTAIEKVTEWTVRPVPVEPTADGLRSLIQNHPLISPIEIRETLDLNSTEEVEELLQPLLQAGEVTIQPVPHGWFVRKESES